MSIQYLILGFLNWKPMSGYDLKKIIARSEILPWSANNNQIYQALVALHNEQWVEKSVETRDGSPNRHVYTITDAGQQALDAWTRSNPEPPVTRKPFLHQLMWAGELDFQTLDGLLEKYIDRVAEKLFLLRVQAEEGPDKPERSSRERFLWDTIHRNWIAQYETELSWGRRLRQDLSMLDAGFRLESI